MSNLCSECGDAARSSLANEVRNGLKARGLWAPDTESDLITAVFLAIEASGEHIRPEYPSTCDTCGSYVWQIGRLKGRLDEANYAANAKLAELEEENADLRCALGQEPACNSCQTLLIEKDAEIERLKERLHNHDMHAIEEEGFCGGCQEIECDWKQSTRDARRVMRAMKHDPDCLVRWGEGGPWVVWLFDPVPPGWDRDKREIIPGSYRRREELDLDEWERRNNLPDIDDEAAHAAMKDEEEKKEKE